MSTPRQYINALANRVSMVSRLQLLRLKTAQWAKQQGGSILLKTAKDKPVIDLIVHPCIVENRLTIVHARRLVEDNPQFLQQLAIFASRHGYVLLADRRYKDSDVDFDRRGGWLPVVALTCGLQTGVAVANEGHEKESQATLALFDAKPALEMPRESLEHDLDEHLGHDHQKLFKELDVEDELLGLTGQAAELEVILQQHYVAQPDDPPYLLEDFKELARYFSRYPEAVALLTALKDEPWQLAYRKDTFLTEVRGSRVQVRAVTVNFDSRAAAKLRNRKACITQPDACTASPADALLHELLHAESALLSPREFIAQGGLNSVIYPYAHEYAVIKREGNLYRAMSGLDGQLRPHRNAHSGKLVASSCVTCID
jgi:hypothetical protein